MKVFILFLGFLILPGLPEPAASQLSEITDDLKFINDLYERSQTLKTVTDWAIIDDITTELRGHLQFLRPPTADEMQNNLMQTIITTEVARALYDGHINFKWESYYEPGMAIIPQQYYYYTYLCSLVHATHLLVENRALDNDDLRWMVFRELKYIQADKPSNKRWMVKMFLKTPLRDSDFKRLITPHLVFQAFAVKEKLQQEWNHDKRKRKVQYILQDAPPLTPFYLYPLPLDRSFFDSYGLSEKDYDKKLRVNFPNQDVDALPIDAGLKIEHVIIKNVIPQKKHLPFSPAPHSRIIYTMQDTTNCTFRLLPEGEKDSNLLSYIKAKAFEFEWECKIYPYMFPPPSQQPLLHPKHE